MNKTKWIIFTVIVAAVFGGVIWLSKSNEPTFEGDASKVISEGQIPDRTLGSKDQKVVLVEYADFQCPGCASVAPGMKELAEKYKDKLTFVYRHYPLTNIHPNALTAATVAEAAGQQGKFFEMADILYQSQQEWGQVSIDQRESVFVGYASNLGLDVEKFKQDMRSDEVREKIQRDRTSGAQQFGVNSTPTFILNGEKIVGNDAVNIEAITKKVEEAIQKAYPDSQPNQQQ